jgi:hypothetical protein
MSPVKTHTGKMSSLRPVGCISDQFPTRGTPDKSPPHTTRSAPTGAWARTRNEGSRREHHHQRVWRNGSPGHASTTTGGHASSSPRQEP